MPVATKESKSIVTTIEQSTIYIMNITTNTQEELMCRQRFVNLSRYNINGSFNIFNI